MSGPVHVIVNPAAGGGRARRLRARLEAELAGRGAPFVIEETRARGDAVRLARRAADAGASAVYAVGGDGTAHEVANGLLTARRDSDEMTAGPALGVVPVGSGNDFAKLLDLSPAAPLRGFASTAVRRFDVGHVEWDGGAEYFINGSGTGIDVEVVRRVEAMPRVSGVAGYLAALLRTLVRFQAIPLRIRVDEREIRKRVMIVAVMNGACQGGGFYVCPGAQPDDARLDVCLIDEVGLLGRLNVLPRVMRGTHVRLTGVELIRAASIEIEADGGEAPLFFQLDGELRQPAASRWCRIRIRPGALRVIAPAAEPATGAAHAPDDADGGSLAARRAAPPDTVEGLP